MTTMTTSFSDLLLFDSLHCGDKIDAEDFLKILNFIFIDDRKLLESALDLIDDSLPIRCIESITSNRKFWIVTGSRGFNNLFLISIHNVNSYLYSGNQYTCLANYCPCRSFIEATKCKEQRVVICKHLVAIKIGTVFESVKQLVGLV